MRWEERDNLKSIRVLGDNLKNGFRGAESKKWGFSTPSFRTKEGGFIVCGSAHLHTAETNNKKSPGIQNLSSGYWTPEPLDLY
jgi:hypothetical protein